jgi:transposase
MYNTVMKKHDARSLPPEVQQYNRDLAIRLFQDGKTRKDIARIIGVNYVTVCDWIRAWRKGGENALQLKKRGRGSEEQRLLTKKQEQVLRKLLTDRNPQQLKLPFALWNRKAIQSVIYQMWRVRIAIRTIGDYMKRWGFTPQKPLKRAYERSPKAVQHWLDDTYPGIKSRAKKEKAEIYWGDETGIRNDCQHSRGYAPKGQTPIVTINAKRFSTNMISAINNRGTLRFMMYNENMTARVLLRFMKRLIKDAGRKVVLILDNLRVHHAKLVKAWLKRHSSEIEVFYLPAYAPDLNPDEYLNNDLKNGIRTSSPARSQSDLQGKVIGHMRMLQQIPERVAAYFRHPSIKYAA